MTDPYENSENMFAHMSVPWQQQVIADFICCSNSGHGGACLDVGSGIGNIVGTLLEHFQTVNAVDVSVRALDMLRQRYSKFGNRVVAQKMDASALAYPDGSFDLVVCTEVIEHCLDPKSAIDECIRVLKPGGFLIVSSPNYLNPAGLFKKFHERVYPRRPWDAWGNHDEGRENFTTALKLRSWVKLSGVRIVSVCGGDMIRAWLPFLRGHYKTIDRHPFLGAGRWWPIKLFQMNYFILAVKPSSRR